MESDITFPVCRYCFVYVRIIEECSFSRKNFLRELKLYLGQRLLGLACIQSITHVFFLISVFYSLQSSFINKADLTGLPQPVVATHISATSGAAGRLKRTKTCI